MLITFRTGLGVAQWGKCLADVMLVWKEGNVLFNNTFNTFYLFKVTRFGHMVKDHSEKREKTHCCHFMCYSFYLAARNI